MLEAIAFPVVTENFTRGRLRGYYLNTFPLVAEQCAGLLWQALWSPLSSLPHQLPLGWAVSVDARSLVNPDTMSLLWSRLSETLVLPHCNNEAI